MRLSSALTSTLILASSALPFLCYNIERMENVPTGQGGVALMSSTPLFSPEVLDMSDPYKAVQYVLLNEGGYIDHPRDRGGETNWGISSAANPDVDVSNLSRDEAIDIYISRYWDRWNLSLIESQPVANKVFDAVVWMGPVAAVKALQRALRAAGAQVRVDGVLGPETAGAANLVQPEVLIPALKSELAGRVREIIARDSSQSVFRRGWINRAYA
jgi:lysozyme family protein